MRIGLYGGSFDPIHFGHLILAREARERLVLDSVIFIPARQSPHKLDRPPISAEARLALVQSAVAGETGFAVDDCEIRRNGVSFTIQTVREYRTRFPEAELFYFIGGDNVPDLPTWVEIEELRRLVQFVVLARGEKGVGSGFPVIERRVDISSSEIRNRIAQGRSVRYLLPEKTCAEIERRGLYRND